MLDVLSYLPQKRKTTPTGWISFNAVCCEHNGDSADRRGRGGIKRNGDDWSYHCFNCGYTASFVLGRSVTYKARKLMQWMGIDSTEIDRLNLESLRHRSIAGILEERKQTEKPIEFEQKQLPDFELIDAKHSEHVAYLEKRCAPKDFPFGAVLPDPQSKWKPRPGVMIPFTFNEKIVGHTVRYLDDKMPKYLSDSQPGYVFGIDQQHPDWQYAIVTEGIFDALSIQGLALMHNDINSNQARLIKQLDREIVVVPDQDTAGLKLIDVAVKLGFSVSIPEWPEDVKDVNDSVQRYGKLATLLMILENAESNKIKIEIRKKQLVKRL